MRFAKESLIQSMTAIVEKKVKKDKDSFYVRDIQFIKEFNGRWIWAVHESRTHNVPMIKEEQPDYDPVARLRSIEFFFSMNQVEYYLCDTRKGTVEPMTYEKAEKYTVAQHLYTQAQQNPT